MLTHNHPGNIAAATPDDRIRWETHNPRALLWQLKQDNPKATDDELLTIFRTRVLADQEYLTAVIDYFFVNASRAWREIRGENRPGPEKVRDTKQKQQKAVAAIRETIAINAKKMVLMDLLLPHGKTLAESTGKECMKLGPKVGTWLTTIGALVPPTKQVGKTLTEKKVRSIWGSIHA